MKVCELNWGQGSNGGFCGRPHKWNCPHVSNAHARRAKAYIQADTQMDADFPAKESLT